MTYLLLFTSALLAWSIGTITAGGAAIIFLLILSLFLPMTVVPILISFVGTFAGVYRTIVFRKHIYWPILRWLLPGTVLGSCSGAAIFALLITQTEIVWLELLLGFMLISCGLLGLRTKKRELKNEKVWLFLPASFLVSTLSGIIGSSTPVVNTLYQRFQLTPNQLVGTKSINLFVLQTTKSIIYIVLIFILGRSRHHVFSGITSLPDFIMLSMLAACGAAIGISFGKRVLNKINIVLFKKIINTMLILFGVYFLVLSLIKLI